MPTALLIIALVGVGVTAYGQYQEGKAAEQQAKAQAAWHKYNADIALREAEEERIATAFAAKQENRKAEIRASRARSLIGASGVDIQGSPLLVAEDEAEQSKLEEINILTAGSRRASFFESQSILDTSKASAAKVAGGAAKRAGAIGAAGSGLIGTASAFSGSNTGGSQQFGARGGKRIR